MRGEAVLEATGHGVKIVPMRRSVREWNVVQIQSTMTQQAEFLEGEVPELGMRVGKFRDAIPSIDMECALRGGAYSFPVVLIPSVAPKDLLEHLGWQVRGNKGLLQDAPAAPYWTYLISCGLLIQENGRSIRDNRSMIQGSRRPLTPLEGICFMRILSRMHAGSGIVTFSKNGKKGSGNGEIAVECISQFPELPSVNILLEPTKHKLARGMGIATALR